MIINGPWSLQAYRDAGIDIGIARIPRHRESGRWATPMTGSKGYSLNANVSAEKLPLVLPPKDGAYLKDRFRLALLGPEAIT